MQGGFSSQARTGLFPACRGLFLRVRNREPGGLLAGRSRYCEIMAGLGRLRVFFITARGEGRKGDHLAGFITLKKKSQFFEI